MPSSSPSPLFSVSALADKAWNTLAEAAFKTGWGPLARVAEAAVVSLMRNITVGQLRVLTNSHVYTFPITEPGDNVKAKSELKAEIRVVNDAFWVRLCAMSDLGFAEAYMYGDVECNDLVSLFQIFLENRENLSNLDSRLSYLFTLPQKITSYRFLNTIGNSRSNISAHYDISNDMFAGFLSEDMTYSCAIFPDLDGDLKESNERPIRLITSLPPSPPSSEPDDTQPSDVTTIKLPLHISDAAPTTSYALDSADDPLYLAQMRKIQHIIDKLHIPPYDPSCPSSSGPIRVLEIGTGWGSLALALTTQHPHVHVDTITLSSAQLDLARQRILSAGPDVSRRINVHLMDYRAMPPEWEGRFDRVVSVEMVEAVGSEFLETYWRAIDWAMIRKGGVGVVQGITIPEARYERYLQEIDFIRKWVLFPGGHLPTLTSLLSTLNAGSKGKLVVESVSNIGPHYARTLREWRRRFEAKFEDVVVPALNKEWRKQTRSPRGIGKEGMPREEVEVFRRKWIYYYCYCEVGFTTRTLGDHIVTFMREGNRDYGCDVYD